MFAVGQQEIRNQDHVDASRPSPPSRSVASVAAAMDSGYAPSIMVPPIASDSLVPTGDDLPFDVADASYKKGTDAKDMCSPVEERLRYFEDAALKGHMEAAYYAAMLLLYGTEELQSDYRPVNPDCASTVDEVSHFLSVGSFLPLGLP